MSTTSTPSPSGSREPKTPNLGDNPGGAMFSSIVISGLIFLLLPLSQYLSWQNEKNLHEISEFNLPPPPPPPPEPPPPEEEIEEEEPPEMEEDRPPPSLEQLELTLNAGITGDMEGDFGMSMFVVDENALGDMIFELEDLDEVPRAMQRVSPIFPDTLRRAGISGRVTVLFIVDENGVVRNPRVEYSSHSEFEKPTIDAIKKWKFTAGVKGGRKVKTRMRLPLSFNLR